MARDRPLTPAPLSPSFRRGEGTEPKIVTCADGLASGDNALSALRFRSRLCALRAANCALSERHVVIAQLEVVSELVNDGLADLLDGLGAGAGDAEDGA